MGLEKVEVENFKSYEGKHIIGPFDKFTSIIGPNGSGKSNIMDAITFCLGINSYLLRTDNIRSLINRSSSNCYVEITIKRENEKFLFKRKITNSGQTGYFFNGLSVGYEDYKKALSDLNILVDVKNFLVFQGDVRNISGMTPMDLTKMFEEMSGSIQYKKDYDEALKKQNSILAECATVFEQRKELFSRIKEEKEGKEYEKNFRKLIEKKNKVQTKILLHSLHQKTTQLKEVGEVIKNLEQQDEIDKKTLDQKEEELEKFKNVVKKAQKEYLITENDLSVYKEKLREIQFKTISHENDSIIKSEIYEEIKMCEENIKTRQMDINKMSEEMNVIEKGYEILSKKEAERKKKIEENHDVVKEIEKREETYLSNIMNTKDELMRLDAEVFPKRSLKNNIEEKLKNLNNKNEKIKKILKEKIQLRVTHKSKIDGFLKSEKELKERINKYSTEYEKLVLRENEKNTELTDLLDEILRRKGEKRISTRKTIIQTTVETLKSMFPGVFGRVVDLIKPTQQKYDIALSAILGGHDQSVIVDNELTAMGCINFIKEKKLCKITFLPLENLKGKEISAELRSMGKPAVDTIFYDGKYKKAVEYLFKNTLIAENLNLARDLVYNKGIKSVCTLNGVFFKSGGYLIEGNGTIASKFKENEFEELLSKRLKILEELKIIKEEKGKLSHVEIAKERLKLWSESREFEENSLREVEELINELENNYKENVGEHEKLVSKFREIENELLDKENKINNLKEQIITQETEIFGDLLKKLSISDYSQYKNLENLFIKKTFEYEGIKRQVFSKLKIAEDEIEELKEKKNNLNNKLNLLTDNNKEFLDSNTKVIKETIDSKEIIKNQKFKFFEEKKNSLNKLTDKLKNLSIKKNEINQKIVESTLIKCRLEEDIKEALDYALLEELEVKRDDSGKIDFSSLNESLEDLKSELLKINESIDEQIPHIKADTKTTNIQAKYNKTTTQYEILKDKAMKAKEGFNEIKSRRVSLFMDCFEKVSKELVAVYKQLTATEFGEGCAYLVLENPTEPYKEGIKFHAMPPSKRLREVRLLSGGEKTMAVLSLIFSFHSHKPAPFYIFDEIDSALDKNNVARVIEFIMNSDAQFLVISLKPVLFQHSNSLVGVYKNPAKQSSNILTYRLD